MSQAIQATVTHLLERVEEGDRAALDELFSLIYDELRQLAHHQRRCWSGDETLGTTVLVHEAYLKLVGQRRLQAGNRAHFLAVASRAMRHILVNYARDRRALKRGGALRKVPFDEAALSPTRELISQEESDELATLGDALQALEQTDPRQARVVECRFFGGMTVEETAAALGISPRTVKRDWSVAQAWLHRRMEELNE